MDHFNVDCETDDSDWQGACFIAVGPRRLCSSSNSSTVARSIQLANVGSWTTALLSQRRTACLVQRHWQLDAFERAETRRLRHGRLCLSRVSISPVSEHQLVDCDWVDSARQGGLMNNSSLTQGRTPFSPLPPSSCLR